MIEITERLRKLSIAVSEQNWQEFSMRVPAEPDRDADIVIMQAAMLIESLRQQLSSRDAEVAELQKAIDENWVTHQQIVTASKERDQLRDEIAELVAALKPFGAIDLVESRLPAEFAMLILRARAAIAKVRKP